MKPAPFTYHRARSVEHALQLLASSDDVKILAGGQSLMPMLNLRVASPANLIDINAVADLAYIRTDAGQISIGAMTRQRSLEQSDLIRRALPLLWRSVPSIGHPQIRSRGTFGGSLCHLDPAAQIPLIAMTLDATLIAAREGGEREIAMTDFAAGLMTTALEPDELLVEARFEPWPASAGWGFAQFARRHGDFSIVSAAVMLQADGQGRIVRASACLGGAQEVPVRLSGLEEHLVGQTAGADQGEAVRASCAALDMLDDAFVPEWYRQRIAPAMIMRAMVQAVSRLGQHQQ